MVVLQTKDLKKSYGTLTVFEKVNMLIHEKEKIGLVGSNGAGKTTLLRCLTGQEEPDEGQVIFPGVIKVGYMEQTPSLKPGATLFEAVLDGFSDILAQREELKKLEHMMSHTRGKELKRVMSRYGRLAEEYERAGGFSCEAMCRRVILGLGFKEEDFDRKTDSFSGGEKTKAGIARLLIRGYDLLLLDEPTNHLDIQSVEWLEDFLQSYPKAFLVISHDRFFLDRVTQRTLELSGTTLTSYTGNYSRYMELKEEQLQARFKAYEKQQRIIATTEAYIEKYRAGIKSKQARGRESQLARLQRIEKPQRGKSIKLRGGKKQAGDSAGVVLCGEDLSLSYSGKTVWEMVNINIKRGEKVALLGANGAGKTSLLKVITGELLPQKGTITVGPRVRMGYFSQDHHDLSEERQVIEEILAGTNLTVGEARDMLAGFLFQGDDVYKSVRDLSGGEKGRLAFLKLYLTKPNFLVLDEPTNHLDITSRQVIEGYLQSFTGTILVVSHDRYFLNKITRRTLELDEARLLDYPGNYTYYREKKVIEKREQEISCPPAPCKKSNKQVLQKQNKAQLREKIGRLEKEIAAVEQRKEEISSMLADAASYKEEEIIKGLLAEYRELEERIPAYYAEWEQLLRQLENI